MSLTPRLSPVVIHVTTFLQGGAGRVVVDLARHQQAHGLAPLVVATDSEEPGYEHYPEHIARLAQAGIPLLRVDSTFKRDPGQLLHATGVLLDAIDASRLELVHTHAAMPSVMAMLMRNALQRRLPVVQTMHGWGIRKSAGQAAADIEVLNTVDAIVTPSRAAATLLEALGVTRPCTVVPCGLPLADDEPTCSLNGDAEALIQQLKRDGRVVILCVGTLGPTKNQELLVEALPAIRASHDAVLVLVGDGSREALRDLSLSLGVHDSVYLAGHQPHAARCIAAADVLVLPSRSESFGLSVVEAFRAGTPVVVSDIPALAELVDDQVTGFRFRDGDASAAAGVIGGVLDLDDKARQAVTQRARMEFEARFSLNVALAGYDRVYAAVAPRGLATT
jgi:glycosyltransferase involved in cell wall biosynthesis